ncbi:MAG: hypothetical protein FWB97_00440 [Oscillospiraceae bacterium]|nr:hypothetical protein [Oscillospiraceae bacterium]
MRTLTVTGTERAFYIDTANLGGPGWYTVYIWYETGDIYRSIEHAVEVTPIPLAIQFNQPHGMGITSESGSFSLSWQIASSEPPTVGVSVIQNGQTVRAVNIPSMEIALFCKSLHQRDG